MLDLNASSLTRGHPLSNLEALAVHDAGASILELILGDPHGLEGGQRRQNGPANPHGVLALRGCHNLDLHARWCQSLDLLVETVLDARVHGGASRQHDVVVQVLANINVALHDGVVSGGVHSLSLLADQGWAEQHFWAAESLAGNLD